MGEGEKEGRGANDAPVRQRIAFSREQMFPRNTGILRGLIDSRMPMARTTWASRCPHAVLPRLRVSLVPVIPNR